MIMSYDLKAMLIQATKQLCLLKPQICILLFKNKVKAKLSGILNGPTVFKTDIQAQDYNQYPDIISNNVGQQIRISSWQNTV